MLGKHCLPGWLWWKKNRAGAGIADGNGMENSTAAVEKSGSFSKG